MSAADRVPARVRLSVTKACYDALLQARDFAKMAGTPRTLSRIRRALVSAQGAIRNAQCRVTREENR